MAISPKTSVIPNHSRLHCSAAQFKPFRSTPPFPTQMKLPRNRNTTPQISITTMRTLFAIRNGLSTLKMRRYRNKTLSLIAVYVTFSITRIARLSCDSCSASSPHVRRFSSLSTNLLLKQHPFNILGSRCGISTIYPGNSTFAPSASRSVARIKYGWHPQPSQQGDSNSTYQLFA